MSETHWADRATQPIGRPAAATTALEPVPGRVPVTRARGGADWRKRSQIAGFVLLCLLIANLLVADALVARSLLGWHG